MNKEITPEQLTSVDYWKSVWDKTNYWDGKSPFKKGRSGMGNHIEDFCKVVAKTFSKYGLSTPVTDDDKPFDTPILHKPISDFFEKPSTVTDAQLQKEAEKLYPFEGRNPNVTLMNGRREGYITGRKHSVTPELKCNCEVTVDSPFSGIPLTIPTHTADCPVHGQYVTPAMSEQEIRKLVDEGITKVLHDNDVIQAIIDANDFNKKQPLGTVNEKVKIVVDEYIAALTTHQTSNSVNILTELGGKQHTDVIKESKCALPNCDCEIVSGGEGTSYAKCKFSYPNDKQ